MAYVPDFEHDVFVSYAHVDDQDPFDPDGPGWVDRFHTAVQISLEQVLDKRAFSMWRDETRLGANYKYDAEIAEKIETCAVFLALQSPGYVDSTYCLEELSHFVETAASSPFGLEIDNRSRIFVADLHPLRPDQQRPEHLGGMEGGRFYFKDGFGNPRRLRKGTDWEEAVETLAVQVAMFLMSMKRTGPAADRRVAVVNPPRAVPAEAAGPVVYLAHATPDLEEYRGRLADDLGSYGIEVLGQAMPALDAPGGAGRGLEAVSRDIAAGVSGALSVHLVGRSYGAPLFGQGLNPTMPELEYEVAVRTADAGPGAPGGNGVGDAGADEPASVIVWTPNEIIEGLGGSGEASEPVDEQQKAFLRRINREPSHRVEWLQQGFQNLIDLVFVRLGIEQGAAAPDATEGDAYVLVSCCREAKHHGDFRRILDCLLQNGIDYEYDFTGEESLRDHASLYDGLLILDLESPKDWVLDRARQAVEAVRRRKGLVAGIYDGPPADRPELGFGSSKVPLYSARQGFSCSVLDPFVARFQGPGRSVAR